MDLTATEPDRKKYNYMENVLTEINKKYISLSNKEVQRNNRILREITTFITETLKDKSVLFNSLFTSIFYGGSFYDGLRVGNATEYDLDLLLRLPKAARPELTNSPAPGFVTVRLLDVANFMKQPAHEKYPGLEKLLDKKCYLITSKIKSWMEGLISKHLTLPGDINIPSGTFHLRVSGSGPAFTIKVKGEVNEETVVMDIDLVPSLHFDADKWPKGKYRSNPVPKKTYYWRKKQSLHFDAEKWPKRKYRRNSVPKKGDFFAVPKRPRKYYEEGDIFWRLSFQRQERDLIQDYRYHRLKPAIRILKKFRDTQSQNKIASYYIKTLFLWHIEQKNKDPSYWADNTLSFIVMEMLKCYMQSLQNGNIPFYWYKSNNLVESIDKTTLNDFAGRVKNIIEDVDKHPKDNYVLATYLLSPDALKMLHQSHL